MKNILNRLFSYSGEINRLEYLLYGVIAPFGFVMLGAVISQLAEGLQMVGALFFLVAFSVALSSLVKRSRDANQNTILMVVLFFAFTIIPVVIALIAPTYTGEKKSSTRGVVIGLLFVIIVLGILAAVAVPKFAAANAKVQHEQVSRVNPAGTTDDHTP